MRALGIDFGEKRIGLAMSDPTGTIATPLETLVRRAGQRVPYGKIERIAADHGIEHVVVGLPLDLAGHETDWCSRVREMGEEVGRRLQVEVSFMDERMTSVRAERTIRSLGLTKSAREDKRKIDAMAAQFILQAWLDQQVVVQ